MEYHEAANMFPMMEPEELKKLAKNIGERGLEEDIVLLDGKILDGRNRYKACELAGVKPRTVKANLDQSKDPIGFVMAKNLHRRHLTPEQKDAAIKYKLKTEPTKSNNQIAKETGASDKTVAVRRKRLEATSEIPKLAKTKGADGKERPATRKTTFTKKTEEPIEQKQESKKDTDFGRPMLGVGMSRANEAINCLIKIPKDDALRSRGLHFVEDWIRSNKWPLEPRLQGQTLTEQEPLVRKAFEFIEKARALVEESQFKYGISVRNKDKLIKAAELLIQAIRKDEISLADIPNPVIPVTPATPDDLEIEDVPAKLAS